jgi:hypothetical protein
VFVWVGLFASQVRADMFSNPTSWTNWLAANNANATFSAPIFNTTPTTPSTGSVYNGFINFGSGAYPDAGTITTGNAQAWYTSPAVDNLFGGTPTAQQQADFTNTVLQRVEQTFQQSGVSVSLTTDPTAAAAHTLSVVSNTSAALLPSAIGMTYVGGNGFSFIDQEAASANSVNQLEWIVAHNVSHELMLAFGVGENYDQSGNFIDARNASFAMITSPNATFSSAAAAALNQALSQSYNNTPMTQAAQVIGQPVPEPATLVLWAVAGSIVIAHRARRS